MSPARRVTELRSDVARSPRHAEARDLTRRSTRFIRCDNQRITNDTSRPGTRASRGTDPQAGAHRHQPGAGFSRRRFWARACHSSMAPPSTSRCPPLQRDLHATGADAQWVVESYAIFLAALILTGGALGDRLGRRRVLCHGVAIFTLASVWCGLAPTIGLLIAGRAVQGIGGALLVPGSLPSSPPRSTSSGAAPPSAPGHPSPPSRGAWPGAGRLARADRLVALGVLHQRAARRRSCWSILYRHVPESRDEAATGTARLARRGAGDRRPRRVDLRADRGRRDEPGAAAGAGGVRGRRRRAGALRRRRGARARRR